MIFPSVPVSLFFFLLHFSFICLRARKKCLSVALYGMFLAVIMPPARNDRYVLYAIIASFVLSGVCSVAPVVGGWSSGTRTIVLTIVISAAAAWLKPVQIEEEKYGQA